MSETLTFPSAPNLDNAGLSVQQKAAVGLWLDNEGATDLPDMLDDSQHEFVASGPVDDDDPSTGLECAECGDSAGSLSHAFDPAVNDEIDWEPVFQVVSGGSFDYVLVQENGDDVDCWDCGGTLNDDSDVIVQDDEGFAYHKACADNVHTQGFEYKRG